MSEKKIKIIYAITKADWGGAQRYVYDLAISLPKNSYDVSVILGNTGTLSQKLETAGIKTIILGGLERDVKIGQDILALLKLIKIFKKEKPDIIHLNSSKMGGLGVIAGKIALIPKIIFTGHGWAFNEDRGEWQKKIIYWLHSLTVKLADKTIAVSQKTLEQMNPSKKILQKTLVIRNGIEQINFLDKNAARQEISKKLPAEIETQNKIWLGTISELHKNKGLKYIIEAMHLLEIESNDTSTLPILVIVGEGERREKLQERVNRYRLQNNIFLVGRIDEASKYLKAFDIFTLTSITEALPYVILEAGSAGLPVIASGVGGIPEIITDMVSGILVRPKEPDEIVKALDFLLKNPDGMASFGQKLEKKIKTDFSKEKMIKETLKIY